MFYLGNLVIPKMLILGKAIVNCGSPEIMNTNQVAQFTSEAWIQVLNEY